MLPAFATVKAPLATISELPGPEEHLNHRLSRHWRTPPHIAITPLPQASAGSVIAIAEATWLAYCLRAQEASPS
jgi:hypothetical protein